MTTSKIILPVIAKLDSQISIQEIIGVQPMSGDVGSIFTMKYSFSPKSKYKFSRNWYIAEFNDRDYREVLQWCIEQFGPHPRRPDAWSRWVCNYSGKIHFRDEKDYVLFLLRWS